MSDTFTRRLVAEALGTAGLLAAVVGSGIMAERLAGGNAAIALLANALATGAALVALILTFGPVSGAHLNPAVSVAEAYHGRLPRREVLPYVAAQLAGALAGVAAGNAMFEQPAFEWSVHPRHGFGQALSELIATFGLLMVIAGCARHRAGSAAFAVAAYITAAYWFTASTSFANPAVTMARSLTNSFSGIQPADVPLFVAAQLLGTTAAAPVARWVFEGKEPP
jgi:glycerol uptake facilitator-like aquaporin